MKVWAMADVQSQYCSNVQVYLGKQTLVPEKGQGPRVVHDLTAHIRGSGRNITVDNFFTNLKLTTDLLNDKFTLVVGTMRRNKREVPPSMLPDKRRPEKSSIFRFTDHTAMDLYVPKRGKAVILLSSMHADDNVSDGGKPDIILFYNSRKGGVDALDQLCATYTTKHKTLGWPLSLFFTFLDIAAVSASIVWCEMHPPSVEVAATRYHVKF